MDSTALPTTEGEDGEEAFVSPCPVLLSGTHRADPGAVRLLGAHDEVLPVGLIDELVARAVAAVEALQVFDPTVLSKEAVGSWAVGVERVRRQVDALGVSVAAHVDTANPFRNDGFFTAQAWLKHRLQLSGSEAFARVQTARMHRRSSVWANSEAAGIVGVAQSALMARVAANPRIDPDVLGRDSWELLLDAMDLPYAGFENNIRMWESLADVDGARDKAERARLRRDAMMRPRADDGWTLTASFDAIGGAEFNEVFAYYIEAEWRTDWAEARSRVGEAATMLDLRRSESQRRADALVAMARAAAAAPAGAARPLPTVNVLIDAATFESTLKGEPIDTRRYRDIVCRTQSGRFLHTSEAVNTALWAHIRRVVYDSASVVIDLGRRSRLFTGSAREAVMLLEQQCGWVGCDMPAGWCQADHSVGWKAHGATVPRNGGPLCGRHNILKEQGYRVFRDADGEWHTYDPDGNEIC